MFYKKSVPLLHFTKCYPPHYCHSNSFFIDCYSIQFLNLSISNKMSFLLYIIFCFKIYFQSFLHFFIDFYCFSAFFSLSTIKVNDELRFTFLFFIILFIFVVFYSKITSSGIDFFVFELKRMNAKHNNYKMNSKIQMFGIIVLLHSLYSFYLF